MSDNYLTNREKEINKFKDRLHEDYLSNGISERDSKILKVVVRMCEDSIYFIMNNMGNMGRMRTDIRFIKRVLLGSFITIIFLLLVNAYPQIRTIISFFK